jgi:hypothetical protein
MFDIDSWNLEPNQEWFVRLFSNVTGIGVELYETQADADAQTNLIDSYTTAGFGSDKEVIFDSTALSLFQTTYQWHMLVSGAVTDTAHTYRIKQFVDLDAVEHPIFRNEALITIRAGAEIDTHTHAIIRYSVETGVHYPNLDTGDIIALVSTRRGLSKIVQVLDHEVSYSSEDGGKESLVSNLTVAEYLALNR